MSLTNASETALLALFFNTTTWTGIADDTATSALTAFYLNLATGDPGETGNQTTSEAAYTSYARESVARASGAGGFTVSGASATLTDATTDFTQASGGSETETHFGIGSDASGTGTLFMSGTISPSIVVASGTTPQLTSATAITAD